VGTYGITPGITSSNYTLTANDGTLTINPAPLTISANSTGKTYGNVNPSFTGIVTGLVNGDTNLTTGVNYTTPALASSSVGTYGITPGITSSNYTLTANDGTLTINPAPLTISANSTGKTYGNVNPLFTGIITGLVNGDTNLTTGVNYTTPALTSSSVGTYGITPGITSSNYTLTANDGTLTINPAPLTISANNYTRSAGMANPTFTTSYLGFKLGETENTSGIFGGNLSFSAPSDFSGVEGSYKITPYGLTSSNYSISFINGTLTVIKPVVEPITTMIDSNLKAIQVETNEISDDIKYPTNIYLFNNNLNDYQKINKYLEKNQKNRI